MCSLQLLLLFIITIIIMCIWMAAFVCSLRGQRYVLWHKCTIPSSLGFFYFGQNSVEAEPRLVLLPIPNKMYHLFSKLMGCGERTFALQGGDPLGA